MDVERSFLPWLPDQKGVPEDIVAVRSLRREEKIASCHQANETKPNKHRNRFLLLIFVGCCLILLITDCLVTRSWTKVAPANLSFPLTKNDAVASSAATPSPTGVLDVFQVYQPVISPSGATAEITMENGSENTSSISPTTTLQSCQLLLMDHSFGNSYGMPFVGTYYPQVTRHQLS